MNRSNFELTVITVLSRSQKITDGPNDRRLCKFVSAQPCDSYGHGYLNAIIYYSSVRRAHVNRAFPVISFLD